MPSVHDTLQAMESMAERAALRELREMLDALLALRTHLVLQERARADTLLLRLDRLLGGWGERQPASVTASPELTLRLHGHEALQTAGYRVHLYDAETGALAFSTTSESFEAAVQLVRFRLSVHRDYGITGSWTRRAGTLAISTPRGQVLARIEPRGCDAAPFANAAQATGAHVPETAAA